MSNPMFTDNDYHRAALDILLRRYGMFDTEDSLAGGTVEAADATLERIVEARAEGFPEIKDPKMLQYLDGWFCYFERQAIKNREDCLHRTKRRKQDEWQSREEAANERKHQLVQLVLTGNHPLAEVAPQQDDEPAKTFTTEIVRPIAGMTAIAVFVTFIMWLTDSFQ